MRLPLSSPSLVRRLIWTLVGSLTVVAILLGAGGAWLIHGIVERTNDRLLGASARAIAETLAVEDGEITLDLPPFALGMLENNSRDNIYYSVRRDGVLLTGYPDLGQPAASSLKLEQSVFRYDRFRGVPIRLAAEARTLPRVSGTIVVQVAETLDARHDLADRMMLGLAALEAALVLIAGVLVWPAVRWSLSPVTRLRAQMDARPADHADFTPLSLEDVPVELVVIVSGFNALLMRLDSAVAGMRRFTADASHQMRTPLAVLRTHLALLKKHGTQTDEGRASLADIDHATLRLQNLLTGLIALARTEEGCDQGAPPTADIRKVARQAAEHVADLAAERRVELRIETPKSATGVAADPVLLTELLANLLDNAIRYNRAGGFAALRVRTEGDLVRIEVEDDGPGVPPEQRDAIFQRFYRLPRDQDVTGSGLGLSIVQALARRTGAEVSVSDGEAGRGLRVSIALRASSVRQRPPAKRRSAPARTSRA